MNKSNLIMEKLEEYQAPECFVMELQNEGVLCASGDLETDTSVSLEDFGEGGLWGQTSLWDQN